MKLQWKKQAIFLFIFSTVNIHVLAQHKLPVVVLSDRVGESIDKEEREQFQLFPSIENFEHATFFLLPDSSSESHVTRSGKSETSTDTIVHYSFSATMNLAEKITFYERIIDGTHKMGDPNISIRTTSGLTISRSDRSWQGIPTTRAVHYVFPYQQIRNPWSYPLLRLSGGFSSYTPDLSELDAAFTAIEEKYRMQGYPVRKHLPGIETIAIFWLSFSLRTSESIGIHLDAGTSLVREMEFHSTSLSVHFFYPIPGAKEIQPYIGAGIDRVWFSANKEYNDRIGSDLGQTIPYLTSIYIKGASNGTSVHFGIDFAAHPAGIFNVFGNYLIVPSLSTVTSEGTTAVAQLSGFLFGIKIGFTF